MFVGTNNDNPNISSAQFGEGEAPLEEGPGGMNMSLPQAGLEYGHYGTQHPADRWLRFHHIAAGIHKRSATPTGAQIMGAASEITKAGGVAGELPEEEEE
jgi:hypothetical protein